MVHDPVVILALTMVLFLVAPSIVKVFKMPGLIGFILAGIIVGPNGLGLLERDQTIVLLGTVGLLLIMFIAGLEIDLDGFLKYRHRSIKFGLLSFIFPQILGTVLGLFFHYGLQASLLLGSILASHTLLGYPIASRLGISKNRAITMTVGGTILTDILALLVLAIISAATKGELAVSFWIRLILSLLIFSVVILKGVPLLAKWFFRVVNSEGFADFIFVLTILFVSAYLAELAQVEPIIGAFLAGLALNRYIIENGTLMNRIQFTSNALFIPFFLLSVGMLVDLKKLFLSVESWMLALLLILFVITGKLFAAYVSGKIYRYRKEEVWMIFGLSIPQAAATLAATLVGFNIGLLDQTIVNGVIMMMLVTCIIGPYVVEKYGRQMASYEGQVPYKENETAQRILIPLSEPNEIESLLDFAFLLRRSYSTEPIYPLTVVQEELTSNVPEVATAERMLGHAVMYGAGAQVPIRVLTRVDPNVAHGIVRAIVEERITSVVMSWNGVHTAPENLFGSILDQVLDQTNHLVYVTKMSDPFNTMQKIIVIIPKDSIKKPYFEKMVRLLKVLTSRLGASMECLIVKEDTRKYEEAFHQIKPNPKTVFYKIDRYQTLYDSVFKRLQKTDLVIVLSARKGTVAWHPELEQIPKKLSSMVSENFTIMYFPEKGKVEERGMSRIIMPKEFLLKRDFKK